MTAVLGIALFLASADAAHPSWMVGTWGRQNKGEQHVDCGSDHDTTYHRDGRYTFLDTSGTWRIEGDRLIETMTDPGGSEIPANVGKSSIIQFKRISRDVLEVTGEYPGRLIKCPGH